VSGLRLTETAINKAIRDAKLGAKRIELTDPDQKGLALRVGKSGSVIWTLACKSRDGRFKRITIGGYPAIGLSAARAKARSLREDVRNGKAPDPKVGVGAKLEGTRNNLTLLALVDLYEAQGPREHRKSWSDAKKRLARILNDVWQEPLNDGSLVRFQRLIDEYGSRAPTSASWAVRTIRPILRWASVPGRQYVAKDTTELTGPQKQALKRDRVLNPDELIAVLRAMRRLQGDAYVDCMKFILLTLLRRSEAENLRWHDVTFGDQPIVRIADTKNGKSHEVPLSLQARHLLLARQVAADKFARNRIVRGVKGSDLVFSNEMGRVLDNWMRGQRLINGASGTSGWHRHDLRRTGATLLGELGVDPHIIEAALNHVVLHSPIASVYNLSRYRPQVADALQRLADKFDELAKGLG
jgi:integrase